MTQPQRDEVEITIATNATVLTIAGSDPSGGAGLQADLKTFQQLGCYGMSVVTLLTVQNTEGVDRVEVMPVDIVQQQMDAVLGDIPPRIIKTGALGNAEMIRAVAEKLRSEPAPVVVDPVLVSKHGQRLAGEDSIEAYRDELLPLANVFTPNRYEAEALLGCKLETLQEMADAAAKLQALGPQFVVLKAGEIDGHRHHMVASGDEEVIGLSMEPIESKHTHGAGCVLSAAIAGRLALTMDDELDSELFDQVLRFATAAVHHAIEFAPELGHGIGPVETRIIPGV
ncbi:MAG: bifunctional hydroxymethylpyrimidine kinase/phosphomethylpyrimidine kinase [Aureliella sp.]